MDSGFVKRLVEVLKEDPTFAAELEKKYGLIYKEESQEILKGQLCYFRDNSSDEYQIRLYGGENITDNDITGDTGYKHRDSLGFPWKHARPVTPDEIPAFMPMFPDAFSDDKGSDVKLTKYGWKGVPDWVNWIATDHINEVWMYKNKPIWRHTGEWDTQDSDKKMLCRIESTLNIDPENSLEGRPGGGK